MSVSNIRFPVKPSASQNKRKRIEEGFSDFGDPGQDCKIPSAEICTPSTATQRSRDDCLQNGSPWLIDFGESTSGHPGTYTAAFLNTKCAPRTARTSTG